MVAITQALNFPRRSSILASCCRIGSRLAAICVSTLFGVIVDNFVDVTLSLLCVDKSVDKSVDNSTPPPVERVFRIRITARLGDSPSFRWASIQFRK